jgi:hypothetical protein
MFPDDAPRRFVVHIGITITDANALIFRSNPQTPSCHTRTLDRQSM